MSLSWQQRKERLSALLYSGGDEDEEGIALDRLTHGQNVIGKTSKTIEIDSLRFNNQDLDVVGTLEVGQFGVIDLVTCRFNNCVYVRKSIEKVSALRTREQCSPQVERDLLLQALKSQSPWAPHLLCAFQTPTHLSLLMDYAEGGTLWDVLESSPFDSRISEADLQWWVPQAVSAIHWCHSQGFAHRDVKPHNFVLTSDAHLLLIDFGSAAPLLPPNDDGSQLLPRQYCLIPCGTCDYISPEILRVHEEALVALEMDDDDNPRTLKSEELGEYGLETDWWSLGAMIYEMAYGVAPFFAPDIRSTYVRIMNYEKSLRFDKNMTISHELQHFLRRLLTHAKKRLGRHNVMEITEHPFFEGIDWGKLPTQASPVYLHLPHFIYSEPRTSTAPPPPISDRSEDPHSQGFPFSALFQSSSASPGLSILRPSPGPNSNPSHSSRNSAASFIGFSWGPAIGAFPEEISSTNRLRTSNGLSTPRTIIRSPRYFHQTLVPTNHKTNLDVPLPTLPGQKYVPPEPGCYSTPLKPYSVTPHATLPRTSTIRRTAPRRGVSDREAMKQLVDCVGMSARKKIMESGRKPKILNIFASKNGSKKATMKKELRFDDLARPIPAPDYTSSTSLKENSRSHSRTNSTSFSRFIMGDTRSSNPRDDSDIYEKSAALPDTNADANAYLSDTTDSEGAPPSPSPSPRPGSATSMMSMTTFSRRSATPTASGFLGSTRRRAMSASVSRLSASFVPPSSGDGSVTATTATTMATSSELLKIPPSSTTETIDSVHENADSHPGPEIVDRVDVQDLAGDNWITEMSSHDQLNELGERHGKIMRDIRHLEHRLDRFLSLVEN